MEITIIRKEQNETWWDFQERVNLKAADFRMTGCKILDLKIKELQDDVVGIIRFK